MVERERERERESERESKPLKVKYKIYTFFKSYGKRDRNKPLIHDLHFVKSYG